MVDLRMLGPLEVVDEGGKAPLGGPKQRAVLALLLIRANRLVTAERLVDELWDEPPAQARVSLQSYVSNLRRALGDPTRIEGRGGGYLLRAAPSEIDAVRFAERSEEAHRLVDVDPASALEKLEVALELWRGRPLADLNGMADRDPVRGEVARLEELHRRGLQDRARAKLAGGDPAGAAAELEALVDTYPLREELWSLYLVALYRSGRQADALAAYQRLRVTLADELGIDPSPELQRTHERVLAHDPTLDPPPSEGASSVPSRMNGRRTSERNPYKGLRAFREVDAGDFFGREPLTRRLAERLSAGRFLAVVGPSGSGKSSVVRAGLVPALRAGAVDGSDEWVIADLYPGAHPLEELEAALLRVAVNPPNSLLEQLERDAGGLLRASKRLLPSADAELVLVVDQFEELYTLAGDEQVRQHFLDCLRVAVSDPRSRVRVVVTIRADMYDRPLSDRGIAELIRGNVEVVVPLSAEGIELAVSGPARRAGVDLEEGLLARIVGEVTEQPGRLPLLQYALTELFDRRDGSSLTLSAYEELGGVSGALARRAEETFTALEQAARTATRQVLLRLVTLGEGAADARRRVHRADLEALDVAQVDEVIEAFGAARLLSFDRDATTGTPTVEVAHEALLRQWERLRGWIDDAREDLRTERRLAEAAREWIEAGRESSYLARGGRLEGLARWRATSDLGTTSQEREFLEASSEAWRQQRVEEEDQHERERELVRRSARRLRGLVAVLALASVIASVLTVFAVRQREGAERQAQVAAARELTAAAVANLTVDPERSILLALAAVERTRGVDGTALRGAEEVLHRAVGASRISAHLPDLGGALAWSPDGSLLAGAVPHEPGTVRLHDPSTGEHVRTLTGHEVEVTGLAFAADRPSLVTAAADGTVVVWDAGSGVERRRLAGPRAPGLGPSFSADGGLLAVAFGGPEAGTVLVWDVATGRLVREVGGLPGPGGTALSPDGERVAFTASFERETAAVVDVGSGEEAFRIRSPLGHPHISWSPDGRWIAAANGGIWDAETGRQRAVLSGHAGLVGDTDWSADSSRVVTAGSDGTKVWTVGDTGFRELASPSAHDTASGIESVAISPGGDLVAATAGVGVRIWDVGLRGSEEWLTLPADGAMFAGLAWSPDDRHVAVSTGEGDVSVFDVQTGERDLTIGAVPASDQVPFRAVDNIEWDPTGELIATSGSDGAVAVWEAATGRERFRVEHGGFTGNVHWSPDGALMAVVSAGGAPPRIVDRNGRALATLDEVDGLMVEGVRFSQDGEIVATTPDESGVKLWDPRTGQLIRTIDTPAYNLTFHPDGERFVTADATGTPRIFDVSTGEELASLPGHSAPVQDVTVTPDGATIATASFDGTVRLWDGTSGAPLLELRSHDAVVHRVRFSSDGARLASVSPETHGATGTVRIWAMDLDDLVALARSELTRGLTDHECRRFLHLDGCPSA